MRPSDRPITITRVVERKAVAVTRPAIARARGRCEGCEGDTELRVVEDRGRDHVVLCLHCRIEAAWAPGVGRA